MDSLLYPKSTFTCLSILYLIEKYISQNMQYLVKLTRRPAGGVGTRFKSDRSGHEKVDFWYVLNNVSTES